MSDEVLGLDCDDKFERALEALNNSMTCLLSIREETRYQNYKGSVRDAKQLDLAIRETSKARHRLEKTWDRNSFFRTIKSFNEALKQKREKQESTNEV